MQEGGFESKFWADHHEEFSDGLHRLFTSIDKGTSQVFKSLVAHLYEAPWLAEDDGDTTPSDCAPKGKISCTA